MVIGGHQVEQHARPQLLEPGEPSQGLAPLVVRELARVRQAAESVTTRAMKARLLDEAVHCYQLAADAERVAGEAADS